jgi:hypothetical protein
MFNIAFRANDTADAKAQLATRNGEQEQPMGDDMLAAVNAVIDALGGTGEINVGLYGDDIQVNVALMRVK